MQTFRNCHGRPAMSCLTMTLALVTGWTKNASSVSAAELPDTGQVSQVKSLILHSQLVPGPVKVAVLLPPGFDPQTQSHKLLLWLHGGGGSSAYLKRELRPVVEAAWARGTLPRLVVAVPSARRSFYMDYRDGSQKWETWILRELLPRLREQYNLRQDPAGTFIGGYSMGGMGSLRIVFKHPDRFAAVAAIAPAIEPVFAFEHITPFDRAYRNNGIYETIYGDPVDRGYWQVNHPPAIARDRIQILADSGLKIYFEVGDADSLGLYRGGEFLHHILLKGNVRHEYRLVHGADHEDATLPSRLTDAMRFLGRTIRSQNAEESWQAQARVQVTAHMRRYLQLFNQQQPDVIAREIYGAPVLLPAPGEEVPALALTTPSVRERMIELFRVAKSNGWKRSVVHEMRTEVAGADMAFVTMTYSRLRAAGEAIPPIRRIAHYVLATTNTDPRYLSAKDRTDWGWRILSVASQPAAHVPTPQAIAEVKRAMHGYLQLLNAKEPHKIAEEVYQTPLMIRGLQDDAPRGLLTAAAAQTRLAGILHALTQKGWHKFASHGMRVHMIAAGLARIEMSSSRLLKDGTAMPPAHTPFSYLWVKRNSGWRLVGVFGHARLTVPADP